MPNLRKTITVAKKDLWYLVGLIASDGCLSNDSRHVSITAKEYDFVEKIQHRIGTNITIGIKNKAKRNEAYHLQFSNKNFYEFLLSTGLTPKKSLILGKINVPIEVFTDFLRGVIDGDGNIRKWKHTTNQTEQWSLRIYSSSTVFAHWLYQEIERLFCVKGCIHRQDAARGRVDSFVLKYGKIAAKNILKKCYYQDALALNRKAVLAKECCAPITTWKNIKSILSN